VLTRVTLDVQPSYLVRQQIFEGLAWDVVFDRFDEVMGSATSVSLFTDYGDTVDELWLKSRIDPEQPGQVLDQFMGAPAATRALHPVARLSPENCTEQLGVPGAWLDRLPHFRMGETPASGDEIQSEYMVPRRHAVLALRTMRELAAEIRPRMWISEIRTVAADDLWLSTAYGTDTVCVHVSWLHDAEAVARVVPMVEEALAPFSPRPHWGKVFSLSAGELEARYERIGDFRALMGRLDPRGAFRNGFVERVIG
jgi:xylitol oxidase